MMSLFLQLPGYGAINSPVTDPNLQSLGGLISKLLPYLFIISGLILFGAIIFSGFNMVMSGGDPKKLEGAKGCILNAFIGFIIIISAYWIIQILEFVLKIKILS